MRFRVGSSKVHALLLLMFLTAILVIINKWFRCEMHYNPADISPTPLFYSEGDFENVEPSYDLNYDYESCNKSTETACEPATSILCNINREYSVNCRREGRNIFVPFSFLAKYFEVKGYINSSVFEWHHSEGNIYKPEKAYSVYGPYSSFAYFNVEGRSRVLCISGKYGVPVSTQWKPEGYFYPIQIAQFGLSHYSKMVGQRGPTERRVLREFLEPANWRSRGGKNFFKKETDEELGDVFRFKTDDDDNADSYIWFDASIFPPSLFTVKLALRLHSHSNFRLSIVADSHTLHYVGSDITIETASHSNNHLETIYGIGDSPERSGLEENVDRSNMSGGTNGSRKNSTRHSSDRTNDGEDDGPTGPIKFRSLLRDLNVDALKGYQKWKSQNGGKKHGRGGAKFRPIKRIIRVELKGDGAFGNFSLRSKDHEGFFFEAVKWVEKNQDGRGGWPIPVERKLANGQMNLKAGWYSAMAQGHCISLLARAYLHTKHRPYLAGALSALQLFRKSSEEGGVRTVFPGNFPWFEEYPTQPGSFVLNGFIYSLIGLLDLKMVLEKGEDETGGDAAELYKEGVRSLKKLLPLFDTGSGSMYDLRHFSLPELPPNLARWEYHTTHVNLLYLLGTVEKDTDVFNVTADRWLAYMKGHRAPHN